MAVDEALLVREFGAIGVRAGAVVIVHASLSAFGSVEGGAGTVVRALRRAVGDPGTVVVPAFTGQVTDPYPGARFDDPGVAAARLQVPVFHDALPTAMGAVPSAVLAHPDRLRSSHPQASVAALGPGARDITAHQPFAYAVGKDSPFSRMYAMDAQILLLGVGHNRNSFLHHAESLVPGHRRKLRRFPYLVAGERVWVEAEDVGDDNDTFFPVLGREFGERGGIRSRTIGGARCQLMDSVPLIDFAAERLESLLDEARGGA